LVGKPDGSGQLQRPRHTWEDRIILKMDLKERGWGMLTGLIWFKKGTKCRLL
jgi:hypothetical protein